MVEQLLFSCFVSHLAVHYNPISRGLALATDHMALLRLKNKYVYDKLGLA